MRSEQQKKLYLMRNVLRQKSKRCYKDYILQHLWDTTGVLFAQHGQTLTGESPEHAQIVGSIKNICMGLDSQIRYRLRMCIWKHWKTPQNRERNMIKLGINRRTEHGISYKKDMQEPVRTGQFKGLFQTRTYRNSV